MKSLLQKNLVSGISMGVIVLVLVGIFVPTYPIWPRPKQTTSRLPTNVVDETQYLTFMIETEGIYETSKGKMFHVIDTRASDLINRIGTVGSGKSRKLGFTILIPPWIVEKALPGKLPIAVREAFNVAKKRDIAVHFSIETHYFWQTRPDLWNYFDPKKPGYDPGNKNNVEWMDWDGTPYPARYVDWGVPQKLPPHMCYNCPKIRSEITRLVSQVVAPPIKAGLDDLKQEGKGYLFAGITVGSEPSLDNYTNIDKVNRDLGRFMDKHNAPKVRLGYNALSKAGYSKKNPPKDFAYALAKINQEFIAFWAKQFVDAGIPSSRLYTHVPANSGYVGSPVLEFTNAPIWIAFNDYSRPGWTTYPDGPLERGFEMLYKELEKYGYPHWGGTEANPYGLGNTKVPPDEYLRRHFDHGATLVVMNAGAYGELATRLHQGIWSREAIIAYRNFLLGRDDDTALKGYENTVQEASDTKAMEDRIRKKVQRVHSTAQDWVAKGGDPGRVLPLIKEIERLLQAGKPLEAEAKADEALRLLTE